MQYQRRVPKRSMIGTRVSAPWSDGRYYCGTIESVIEQPNGQFTYSVLFDDGYTKLYFHKDIVGPGFNNMAHVYLKHGQRVFVTYNGREVAGTVVKHNRAANEVLLEVECSNGELVETAKKLEEVRLLESRKSLRLNSDADGLRRSTQGIDVPASRHGHRRRQDYHDARRSSSDDRDTEENVDVDSDMQLAAVALQNLSCSPASPNFSTTELSRSPASWTDRSRHRPSPSPPPQKYSLSAPHGFFGSASTDEGIEVEDSIYQMDEEVNPKRRKASPEAGQLTPRIRYKCTWRGCRVTRDDCDSIEQHIRDAHLGPRDDDLSDHEEEFYYEELEITDEMDEVTSNMEVMTCASPTQHGPLNGPLNLSIHQLAAGQDHDYNKKEMTFTPPHASYAHGVVGSTPILIPGAMVTVTHGQHTPPGSAFIFPQNSPYSRQTYKMSPLSPTSSSPKHAGGAASRKSRSDIKKCRKVYGMENRDMWCTQCKWKKACTRFLPDGAAQ